MEEKMKTTVRFLSMLLAVFVMISCFGALSERPAPENGGVTVFDIPIEDDDFKTAGANAESLEEGVA